MSFKADYAVTLGTLTEQLAITYGLMTEDTPFLMPGVVKPLPTSVPVLGSCLSWDFPFLLLRCVLLISLVLAECFLSQCTGSVKAPLPLLPGRRGEGSVCCAHHGLQLPVVGFVRSSLQQASFPTGRSDVFLSCGVYYTTLK